MPTYEDLRAYFDASEAMTQLARAASEIPIVHGFTLDLDPLWVLLYDLEDGVLPENERHRYEYLLDGGLFRDWWKFHPAYPEWPFQTPYQGYRRRDLNGKVSLWNEIARPLRSGPVVLTIVYGPLKTPAKGAPEPPEDGGDSVALRQLVALIDRSPAAARIEERPRARLAYAAGDEINTSASKTGTYGGTLSNARKKQYGMTCAHVADTGDDIFDVSGKRIGTVIHHAKLHPLPAQTVCDPVVLPIPNPYPGNDPPVNMFDFSLIELTKAPAASSLGGVAASLTPGQNVTLRGKSGTYKCKLGSLAISYAFTDGTSTFCFRDQIELKPQPVIPIGGALGHLVTSMPMQGDSGGWVLTDDATPLWAGVFFGEDGSRGYCSRASWAHDWAEKQVGGSLSV
ncbi:hypothetical protein [Agrobacterium tumefaciens]|uniref:hypothetical protein n=1 Tax=Agrobacterium tumefaciens TaxID=358 RepID=UPI000DD4D437